MTHCYIDVYGREVPKEWGPPDADDLARLARERFNASPVGQALLAIRGQLDAVREKEVAAWRLERAAALRTDPSLLLDSLVGCYDWAERAQTYDWAAGVLGISASALEEEFEPRLMEEFEDKS